MPNIINKRAGLAVGILCCLLYAGLFALPEHVSFSYADTTCVGHLALLPDLHRAVDTDRYKLEHQGGITAGSFKIASTKVCFVPNATPKKGVAHVASAPFGGWIFRTRYDIAVGDAPKVLGVARLTRALGQPLALKLSQPDKVFRYYLSMDGKEQLCAVKSSQLTCGVDKLGLKQGLSYEIKLERSFQDKKAGEFTGIQVAILPAAKVTASSITPDATIYSKPKSADITLDHTLATAMAKLEMIDGDKTVPVNAHVKVDGARVLLNWDDDLPREKTFKITLTAATASDGSMLEDAYRLSFRTSGGPKVTGINIGASVAANTRVVVTFDQSLSRDSNISGLAKITGGGANISRLGSNQVVFSLSDVPRCGAFTLSIAKGLMSEGGIVSSQDWSHASRVSCRATRTIGYSVKGRPILAYYYGTGPTTILFTGGIHGDEPSGRYIMEDWASYLDANGYKIPANKQVVIVPNLNPDGFASNQRYNANNVNLDRNFPSSDWISDISLVNGRILPLGGGATPLSEPETQAIANLSSSLQLRAEISFHASGSIVGANKVADSVAIGSLYARGVGYGTMFNNPEAIMGYTLTGEYETWMGEKAGTPAILIELPTSSGRYFSRHLNMLWAMVNL